MNIAITITPRGKQMLESSRQRSARLERAMPVALDRAAHVAAGIVVRESLSGNVLKRRSGALARSVKGRVRAMGFESVGLVGVTQGNAAKYARLLEHGGTITAKGKKLAIPIGAALTATGRPRYPGGPRSVPGLRLVTRRGRPPLLVRTFKSGRAFVPLFVLKTSVKIPAFRWLSKGMETARERIRNVLQREIDRAMRERS